MLAPSHYQAQETTMLKIARSSRLAAPSTQAARRCIWGLAEKSDTEADLTLPLENVDCPAPLFDGTTATQATALVLCCQRAP